MVASQERLSLTTHIPGYDEVKFVINFLDNKSSEVTSNLFKKIKEMRGNPQNTFDFSKPEEWANDYLEGKEQELAIKFWQESGKKFNPNRIHLPLKFSKKFGLLEESNKIYKINNKGKAFAEDNLEIIKEIDIAEGLDILLNLVNKLQPCKKSKILPHWRTALIEAEANLKSKIVIQQSLTFRLTNLCKRNLLERTGHSHEVTQEGKKYLNFIEKNKIDKAINSFSALTSVENFNNSVDRLLIENLKKIEAENFEYLIAILLEEMGYENVEVSRFSGDKGIDITAKKVYGLTEIDHVFQVKRWRHSIQAKQIREFFGAMAQKKEADIGTFITLSEFSLGAKEAVKELRSQAIITLIDGKTLINLLKEHQVGIAKESVDIYNTVSGYFKQDFKKYFEENIEDETNS